MYYTTSMSLNPVKNQLASESFDESSSMNNNEPLEEDTELLR